MVLAPDVGLFDGSGEVKHGEQGKDAGLNKADEQPEGEDELRNKIRNKRNENDQQFVLCDHVSEKTERE